MNWTNLKPDNPSDLISSLEIRSCLMMFNREGGNFDDIYELNRDSTDTSIKFIDPTKSPINSDQYSIVLKRVHKTVNVIIGTITIYNMSSTAELVNFSTSFTDTDQKRDLFKFPLPSFGKDNSQIVFKLWRKSPFEPNSWKLTAIGWPTQGNNVIDLIPAVQESFVDRWSEMFRWTMSEITIVSATNLKSLKGKGLSNPYAKVILSKKDKVYVKNTDRKENN